MEDKEDIKLRNESVNKYYLQDLPFSSLLRRY